MSAPQRQASSSSNISPEPNIPYVEIIATQRETMGITFNYSGTERRASVTTQSYSGPERRTRKKVSPGSSNKRRYVRRKSDQDIHDMVERAVHYHFILARNAQILSFCCILGGMILFVLGMSGKMNWTVDVWGMSNRVSGAAPGATLFIVGLLYGFMTRFCVKNGQIGR